MRHAALVTASVLVGLVAGCQKPQPQAGPVDLPPPPMEQQADAEPSTLKLGVADPPTARPAAQPLEALAPAPIPVTKPAPTPPPPEEPFIVHTIQKGDTLWSIAKKHLGDGKRWQEIVAANPGLEPQRLEVGKQVRVPRR